MFVVSKNGYDVFNLNLYCRVSCYNRFVEAKLPNLNIEAILGNYFSPERANEVFKDLLRALENGEKFYRMPKE